MNNHCDICGRNLKGKGRYHSACLRHLFGVPALPSIELKQNEVLTKAQELAGKLSISGVQPKLSMARKGSHLLPVEAGGQFILKPQTGQFPELPENENLCMNIAGLLDINIPPHGLFELQDGPPAYLVLRFDRTKDGRKLRCEDFAQILEAHDKYTGSLEQIGNKLREVSGVPGLDIQFFFERVLLNFLLGNGDAHLKNFSMLETEEGELRLSPAYDIVCSKAVLPKELDCALTLNGKQNKIGHKDFEQFGAGLKIPSKVINGIFERFRQSHPMMIEQTGYSHLSAGLQESVHQIITERHQRLFG